MQLTIQKSLNIHQHTIQVKINGSPPHNGSFERKSLSKVFQAFPKIFIQNLVLYHKMSIMFWHTNMDTIWLIYFIQQDLLKKWTLKTRLIDFNRSGTLLKLPFLDLSAWYSYRIKKDRNLSTYIICNFNNNDDIVLSISNFVCFGFTFDKNSRRETSFQILSLVFQSTLARWRSWAN